MARIRICGIYKITSPTGKIYVGQSVSIYKRWENHKNRYLKYPSKLSSSFVSHGTKSHLFEILEECDVNKLNERECYWINELNTFNTEHGLNLREGGDRYIMTEATKEKLRKINLGKKHSEATKAKCSIASKKRVITEEWKIKISLANKGRKMPESHRLKAILNNKLGIIGTRGKKYSEESKAKMKGKKPSQETIDKIRSTMTGRKYSKERVEKSNEAQRLAYRTGKITVWNKGKTMSDEDRQLLSQRMKEYYKNKKIIAQEE